MTCWSNLSPTQPKTRVTSSHQNTLGDWSNNTDYHCLNPTSASESHFSALSLTSGYWLISLICCQGSVNLFWRVEVWTTSCFWQAWVFQRRIRASVSVRGLYSQWTWDMICMQHPVLMRNHIWYFFFNILQKRKGTWSLHVEHKSTSSKKCCPKETQGQVSEVWDDPSGLSDVHQEKLNSSAHSETFL